MSDKQLEKDPLTNDPVLDHEYDGIKELDNPLPQWWLATFYIAITFSIFYVGHLHFGSGMSIEAEYNEAVREHEVVRFEAKQKASDALTGVDVKALLADQGKMNAGAAVYQTNCLACHGDKLQGSIGPNLTDNFWIHGDGSINGIAKIIKEGVAAKGMPPWAAILKPEQIINVSGYVLSKVGSNPPGAKAPQGTEIK